MSDFAIIPAIDIKDGRCVRLYQGDYQQITVYDRDPVAVAQRWAELGAQQVHVVDLDGAKAGRPINAPIVFAIVRAVNIPVQLGGGLRDQAAVEAAINLGVARVVLGTAALRDPGLIGRLVASYGERIVVGVDARDGWVATAGWTETSQMRADELVRRMGALGVQRIIYTDIARDGTLQGPNVAAVEALVRAGGPAIIASGGVSTVDDLLALARVGAAGAIVGRALYTGSVDLPRALEAVRRLQHNVG
ncbi:1-(5-phosphoribosyl)-5-[(5-phosphoribosylamino)methylideneamino]imidazole-4-carboxamide isomerase [Kallotenue papyrolyticum]|uniref:1-(5-phosphoribosyl)-5-[(5- phosphoribosylamino)methylideneamino]imidazole-4- carboxamide isomerase n=1 Tax=Kallotenue papyrolyticum TaxID=1325125 RepID=UPI0004B4C1AC|nr:1-(5-phosphoribosyl)-5-[(5-phosphoribosylamino)methylideneamino]imidazole-4-carboxamide isomerase [Kallotenue papyrolyticum]